MNNLYENLEKSIERKRIFLISILSACFSALIIIFIDQEQQIQSILIVLTLQGLSLALGVFSKYFTSLKLLVFLTLMSIGVQLTFFQSNSQYQRILQNSLEDIKNQSDFGIVYYFFGSFHILIVKSVSSICLKIILLVFLFQTSIFLVNKWQIHTNCFLFGQIAFVILIALVFLDHVLKNKVINYFLNLAKDFSEIYKKSCDSIIISSHQSNKYDIQLLENPSSIYYKNCLKNELTSTRDSQKARMQILQQVKIQQLELNQKNKQKVNILSDIVQKIQDKNFTLDYLVRILYQYKELWNHKQANFSSQISQQNNNLKYQQQPRNSLTLKYKQKQLCSFQIQNIYQENQNENQDLKFQPFSYEGKIYNVKNPFTGNKHLVVFIFRQQKLTIPENSQQAGIGKISEFYNSISVSTTAIKQILKIPLIQSVNEILAKIQLMINNKVNETVNYLPIPLDSDKDILSGVIQSLQQKSIPKKKISDQMNKVKIQNNLTILQQNILYLQSILQYEHQFIESELLKDQIQMKIQKFYLQEFLDEIKGIITTQFFSYLQEFNIQSYFQEILKQQSLKIQALPVEKSKKLMTRNSNLKLYLYTDLSILKYILIIICEKIIKANDFEKNQILNLIIKEEDNDNVSFIINFSQIKRKVFIENHLQKSLSLLGSKTGFEQVLKLQEQDSICLQTNRSQFSPRMKNNQTEINDEFKQELDNQGEQNEQINLIKFTISKDLSQQKQNLDAFILNNLRENKQEEVFKKQDIPNILNQSQEITGEIRQRQKSKYREQKLEYLVESLRFDQFETQFSAASEPFENPNTEQCIRVKNPSIFYKIQKNNNTSVDFKVTTLQTQYKLNSQEKSFKDNSQTKTVFIILQSLQSKDEIESVVQKKFNFYTNIYEFQTLIECIQKLQSEKIFPDIFIVDSKIFVNSEYSFFEKLFKLIQTNCKSTLKFYIFNNEQEEQDDLQQIFYKPQFKIIKYAEINSFLNEFNK
ncbi:hypothetical protein ABPG74_002342 [Tetrahymena malaccensis]